MNGELLVFKIWSLCEAKGIKKGQFYETVGITPATMSAYKSGKSFPSVDTLLEIAHFLDVNVSYLLSETEDSKKKFTDQSTGELRSQTLDFLNDLTSEEIAELRGYVAAIRARRKPQ